MLLQRASEETRTASKGKKSLRAMARRRRGTSTLSHTGPGRGPNDVATGAATVVEHKGLCLYCNEPVLSTQLRGFRMKHKKTYLPEGIKSAAPFGFGKEQ